MLSKHRTLYATSYHLVSNKACMACHLQISAACLSSQHKEEYMPPQMSMPAGRLNGRVMCPHMPALEIAQVWHVLLARQRMPH